MSEQYFGRTSTPASELTGYSGYWIRNKNVSYTCPGSGSFNVTELSHYGRVSSGSGNIRLALYDTSHNKVCEGSAEVSGSGTAGWQGHIGAANITPNPTTITGGVSYDIVISTDSDTWVWGYDSGTSGDVTYGVADYTGGFPSSLADSSDQSLIVGVRCGVDAASFSGSLLAAGFWQTTYHPMAFWAQDFWTEYGAGGAAVNLPEFMFNYRIRRT